MFTLRITHVFADYNAIVIYSNPLGDKVMMTFHKTCKTKKSTTYHRRRTGSQIQVLWDTGTVKKGKAVFKRLLLCVFGRLT
jgi:hypothetical protein